MIVRRIHHVSRLTTVLLSGFLTGFVLSRLLILGPWFTWFATEPGKIDLLYRTYSEFRANHPPTLYNSFFLLQFFPFLVFLVFSIVRKHRLALAIPAFAASFLVGMIHFMTGFRELEGAVLSGTVRDAASVARYARMNVPVHLSHTAGILVSFVLLCFYFKKEDG